MKKKRKLTNLQMITYAIGELGVSMAPQVVVGWLLYFYSPPVEEGKVSYVPLVALGILLALGRLSEGFSNPFVGHLSDTLRSRWGRRIPFMVFGAPILSISFVLMWFPLTHGPSLANTIYLGTLLVVFWFAYAATVAPYLSLLPEITPYSQERVVLSSWMALSDVLGLLLGMALVGAIIDNFKDGITILRIHIADGYKIVALLFGILTLLCFYAVVATIRETKHSRKKEVPFSFLRSGWECLKNFSFIPFVLSGSCYRLSLDMVVAAIPFAVVVIMKSTEAMAGATQGVIVIMAVVFFPLVNYLTEKYGKRFIYLISFIFMAIIMCLLPTVGHWPIFSPLVQGFILFGLSAFPVSIYLVIYRPLLADVIDYDEKLTGFRREAMYNGMEGLITRFAAALAPILLTTIFSKYGNTPQHSLGIVLVGPVAGLVTFLGFFLFLKFPFK